MYAVSNPNLHSIYLKAHKSLKACPKEFTRPAELQQLKFIGPSICKVLEVKFIAYCEEKNIPVPESSVASATQAESSSRSAKRSGSSTSTQTTKRKKQPWVPRFRSGGYAILLTLYHSDCVVPGSGMSKSAIVPLAESLCDVSFKANPNIGVYYSAWSSITTLLKNELVTASQSRNATYIITDEGRLLAEKLLQAERESRPSNGASELLEFPVRVEPSENNPIRRVQTEDLDASPNTIVRNRIAQAAPPSPTHSEQRAPQKWPAGSYTVKLYLDNREIRSSDDRDFFKTELIKQGVATSVVALSVGDVVWVAEHNTTKEIAVLDYILERKRLDDLVHSIHDGRFTEQKARLKRSGLEKIIYLVEEPLGLERGIYAQHIKTAMSQAIALDNFFLKRTSSSDDTVQYLAKVTKELQNHVYKEKELCVISPSLDSIKSYTMDLRQARRLETGKVAVAFESFQAAMSKSSLLSLRTLFIKMLMAIRGITLDKALAIQKVYPTPRHLLEAYQSLSTVDEKKLMLFTKLGTGIMRKKITKLLSEKVYEVWGKID